MKRILALLIVPLVIGLSSCSQQEVDFKQLVKKGDVYFLASENKEYTGLAIKKHYDDTVSERINFDDGLLDGMYESWHTNGNMSTQGEFSEGVKVGAWITWNEAGTIIAKQNYKNGKLHGKEELFYSNGQLEVTTDYVNNKVRNRIRYDVKGGLIKESHLDENNYLDGEQKLVEKWDSYSEPGEFYCTFSNGTLIAYKFTHTVKGVVSGIIENNRLVPNSSWLIAGSGKGTKFEYKLNPNGTPVIYIEGTEATGDLKRFDWLKEKLPGSVTERCNKFMEF